MKSILSVLLILSFIVACNDKGKAPDISGIKVNMEVVRFDKDFFSIDTNNTLAGITALRQKYPYFVPVFFGEVLGLPDSNAILAPETKRFISLNRSIYEAVEKKYNDFSDLQKQFEKSFSYVKYYYPSYKIPRIITLIGPIDLVPRMQNGDYSPSFLHPEFLAICMHLYLGKDFDAYQASYFINNIAPQYISRRFSKEYMVADAMRLIVDNLFPEKSSAKPLVEQMIERGKQWWMLDKFMPGAPDSVKTGYTQQQLNWCKEYEGDIWNQFVSGEILESIDPETVQTYIGASPYTQTMPEVSPGNIGPWVGWQIIKKFEEKNPSLSVSDIMKTPARKILQESKYKPR